MGSVTRNKYFNKFRHHKAMVLSKHFVLSVALYGAKTRGQFLIQINPQKLKRLK